jgi:hypothetical protein
MIKNKEEKDNASINITSLDHYNQLLSDGFEVKSVRFYGHPPKRRSKQLGISQ